MKKVTLLALALASLMSITSAEAVTPTPVYDFGLLTVDSNGNIGLPADATTFIDSLAKGVNFDYQFEFVIPTGYTAEIFSNFNVSDFNTSGDVLTAVTVAGISEPVFNFPSTSLSFCDDLNIVAGTYVVDIQGTTLSKFSSHDPISGAIDLVLTATGNSPTTPVPEPAEFAMLSLGLLMLSLYTKKTA